jgi:hypothetical protein
VTVSNFEAVILLCAIHGVIQYGSSAERDFSKKVSLVFQLAIIVVKCLNCQFSTCRIQASGEKWRVLYPSW